MAALLRLRKIEENQALGDLSRVIQKFNIEEERITEAKRLVEEEERSFFSSSTKGLDLEILRSYNRYLDRLEHQVRQSEHRLEEMRPELIQEQRKVTEAAKKRRVVELLDEKHRERYNQEKRRLDRKELADANAMRLAAKSFLELPGSEDESKIRTAQERDTGDLESSAGDEEERRPDKKKDIISDYFENLGMDDPREKRR